MSEHILRDALQACPLGRPLDATLDALQGPAVAFDHVIRLGDLTGERQRFERCFVDRDARSSLSRSIHSGAVEIDRPLLEVHPVPGELEKVPRSSSRADCEDNKEADVNRCRAGNKPRKLVSAKPSLARSWHRRQSDRRDLWYKKTSLCKPQSCANISEVAADSAVAAAPLTARRRKPFNLGFRDFVRRERPPDGFERFADFLDAREIDDAFGFAVFRVEVINLLQGQWLGKRQTRRVEI